MAIKVLVFESDPSFAETLRAGLVAHDCEVTVVDDANSGLATASSHRPDLILLAIELPRMNGFSVCNKLKRDPALKDVPLIIMSSESTEETFEQHRRLRTRAEDYVHKPIGFEDLLARIQTYVSLASTTGATSVSPPAADEGIVLDDDIEIEDAEVLDPAVGETRSEPPSGGASSTREGMVDADVEDFAEQAFGALIDEPEIAAPSIYPPSQAPAPVADVPADPTGVSAGPPQYEPEQLAEAGPPGVSSLAPTSAAPEAGEDDGMVELDEVEIAEPSVLPPAASVLPEPLPPPSSVNPVPTAARLASMRPSSLPPRAAEVGDVGKYREELEKSRQRVKELEDELRRTRDKVGELEEVGRRGATKDVEVQRLQRELTDAQAKLATSGKGAGSAREFLDLREQLNKKDKDILDFKDQLSYREKELLALRDSSLLLEREKADMSDRIAELEKQLLDVTRASDAARSDKDQAVKRADDFKRKAEKNKADLDARVAEIGELHAAHQAAIAEKEEQKAALVAEHLQALQEAERAKALAVSASEATGRELAEEARREAREAAIAEHEQALVVLREQSAAQHAAALSAREAELGREHEAKLAAQRQAGEDALAQLRAEHEQALLEREQASQKNLAQREAELIAEHEQEQSKEAADHAAALLALVDQKQASEAARDSRIAALEADLTARGTERDDAQRAVAQLTEQSELLGAERDEAERTIARLTERCELLGAERDEAQRTIAQLTERSELLGAEVLERTNERDSNALTLSEREAKISQLEADLAERTAQRDAEKVTVEERDAKVTALEAALTSANIESAELGRELSALRARLERASGKWSEDRSSLERAKDALAAALAQIEEAEGRPFD